MLASAAGISIEWVQVYSVIHVASNSGVGDVITLWKEECPPEYRLYDGLQSGLLKQSMFWPGQVESVGPRDPLHDLKDGDPL